MINGTGSVSLRKKDLENQRIPTVGFQKTVFAHKATVGATGINLAALTTPTELTALGFSQPSVGELQNANLLFYRNNLKLVSSLRGQLVDFLSYTVAGSTQITFQGFTAADGEIFVGTIDYSAVSGVKVVDAAPTVATGILAANTTDFNSGSPFKVGMYSTAQVGAVLVYLDGMQQFRNTGNSSVTLDGNYYEVDAGGGLGVIIRFNQTDVVARSVLVVSNGLVSERPDGSMMAAIESTQGQINNLATYVAAAIGQPLATVLGGAPSNVDLKAFGDRVLNLESRTTVVEGKTIPATATTLGLSYLKIPTVYTTSFTVAASGNNTSPTTIAVASQEDASYVSAVQTGGGGASNTGTTTLTFLKDGFYRVTASMKTSSDAATSNKNLRISTSGTATRLNDNGPGNTDIQDGAAGSVVDLVFTKIYYVKATVGQTLGLTELCRMTYASGNHIMYVNIVVEPV